MMLRLCNNLIKLLWKHFTGTLEGQICSMCPEIEGIAKSKKCSGDDLNELFSERYFNQRKYNNLNVLFCFSRPWLLRSGSSTRCPETECPSNYLATHPLPLMPPDGRSVVLCLKLWRSSLPSGGSPRRVRVNGSTAVNCKVCAFST